MSDKNKSTNETADDSNRSPQVGALLRASRLRVGEDLREVSDNLCIRFLYLEAIEECRYEDLPGDTYAIGFIRSYAEHLGLDGEEVIRRYRLEKASSKRLSDLSFPTPVAESGVPKGAIVLVGVVLAVLVYGGWYATTTDDSILSDLISPVPERLQHLVENENAQTSETAPESSSTSTSETSDATDQNADGVNTETQEALQANTAEAIAEATEAARDSIGNTNAAVSEVMTETASPTVEAVTNEAAVTTEDAIQSATDTTEAVASQVSETANEASNVADTRSDPMTSAADGAATDVTSTDTAVNPEPAPETQPTEVTTSSNASSEPQEVNETEQSATSASEQTTEENASANTETTETAVEETSPTPTPVVDQVSAEDLNAQSLQSAVGESITEPQTEQPTASASEPTTAAPEVASTTSEATVQSSGIVVRAIDNSWVQITDPANGEILFTGLMAPGATFDVPARNGLLLDTGNAGAIDIIVNGNTVPKLGGEGTVRKGVALNSSRLIAGTAAN